MVRRKLNGSSTLLDFFSSSAPRNQLKESNFGASFDSTRPSSSRFGPEGSSKETALLIDDSSGDEGHRSTPQSLGPPQKKTRQGGPGVSGEDLTVTSRDIAASPPYPSSDLPSVRSKLVILDDDEPGLAAIRDWVLEDDEIVESTEDALLGDLGEDGECGAITGDTNNVALPSRSAWGTAFDEEEPCNSTSHLGACLKRSRSDSSQQSSEPVATSPYKPNIFSILMSSHIENTAWKQAELDHARPGTKLDAARLAQKGEHGGRRLAPFYKVMPGMPIAVDAFRYGKIPGVKAYFLTHAHSDHYTALNEKWANGPIYCSETTGNLIRLMLGVNSKWIHPVPMDVPTLVPETEVTVTLVEANHCPGSVLFLFEGRRTVNAGDSTFKSPHVGSPRVFRYLHCGDFRASPQHALHAAIKGKKLDIIYLDTTYLNPKYCFPPQRQVIDACATLATRLVLGTEPTNSSESDLTGKISMKPKPSIDVWARPIVKGQHNDDASLREGRTLVMVGTYSIGKERIVKAIANALSSKVYCDKRKAAILRCQDDPELHALLTNDPYEAQIHLVPLGALNRDKIGDYLSQFKGAYTRVVGFRPTGWTYSPPAGTDTLPALAPLITRMQSRTFLPSSLVPTRNSTPRLMLYGVPYSEHSSFLELSCFALSTHWDKIIATVNVGTESGRGKMNRWFEKWESEIKRRREKGENGMVGFRSIEYW